MERDDDLEDKKKQSNRAEQTTESEQDAKPKTANDDGDGAPQEDIDTELKIHQAQTERD